MLETDEDAATVKLTNTQGGVDLTRPQTEKQSTSLRNVLASRKPGHEW